MAWLASAFSGNFLTSLTVTPEQLQAKATVVQKHIRDMQQNFRELENCVNKTRGYWIGEAGDTHRDYYSARKDDIHTIFARLNEDVTDLQSMAAVYIQTEQKVTAIAADLPSDAII